MRKIFGKSILLICGVFGAIWMPNLMVEATEVVLESQLSGITLEQSDITLTAVGESVTLTASVMSEDEAIVWKSSNEKVATVTQDGVVTALKNGTATITATLVSTGAIAKCNVTVTIAVTGITLNSTTAFLSNKGELYQLTATVTPNEAANKLVIWTSSDTSVVTVSATGLVKAVKNGSATITVKTVDGSYEASCNVIVSVAPSSVTLNEDAITLTSREEGFQLVATVEPDEAAEKTVTWKSSNTKVASVDENGVVTAVGNGNAIITVTTTRGAKEAICAVKVSLVPAEVVLNQTAGKLTEEGQTLQLSATVLPDDAINKKVVWESSDPSIATVDENGLVTAMDNGTVTITVRTVMADRVASCEILVQFPDINGVHQGRDGNWYYYQKGKIIRTFTGLADNAYGIWYVVNGQVDFEANGLIEVGDEYCYIVDGKFQNLYTGFLEWDSITWYLTSGKVDTSIDGVVQLAGQWYYVQQGKLQTDYIGFANNQFATWYVVNGKVDLNVTGVVPVQEDYYYVVNNRLQTEYSGFLSIDSDVWYILRGKVDSSNDGVRQIGSDWYYVHNGKVQNDYVGFGSNEYGTWYIVNGRLVNTVNGLIMLGDDWFYVLNGKLQTGYSGLQSNEYGTWYVESGQVDLTETGVIKSGNDWFYVLNGRWQSNYTGLASNEFGTWYIANGRLDSAISGLIQIGDDWFYIRNGRFQATSTEFVGNEYGIWYVVNGKVGFNESGLIQTGRDWYYVVNSRWQSNYVGIASNDFGRWYIADGKVDFTYTGNVTFSGITYEVVNGRVIA